MSDSLAFFFNAAEETLTFDYQGGGETAIDYPHTTGWRTLPFAVIVQTVNGRVQINHEDGSVYEIDDRAAFCIPPHVRHKLDLLTHQPGISRWSHVDFSLPGSTSLFSLLELPIAFSGEVAQSIGDLNGELASLHTAARPTLAQILRRKSLGFALAATIAEVSVYAVQPRAPHISLFVPLLKYINENLAYPLSRDHLAASVHLSPSRFYTLFKEVVGQSPSDYIQHARLEKARHLLVMSDLTVHEIALSVGYGDLFYFSRLFKKHYGLSPSYYRNSVRHGY